ncbi:MAG: hypothetical protein WC718_10700 [Phycisphaerales bacterium]|jgi:hypothetical protein
MNVLGMETSGTSDEVMNLIVIFAGVAFVILCGAAIAIVAIREREKSRRELAAYVAEGSMTPEHAALIMHSKVTPAAPARTPDDGRSPLHANRPA